MFGAALVSRIFVAHAAQAEVALLDMSPGTKREAGSGALLAKSQPSYSSMICPYFNPDEAHFTVWHDKVESRSLAGLAKAIEHYYTTWKLQDVFATRTGQPCGVVC